ncbi:MAG: Ig-like domain-containing protein [Oscillospiraceae bacterium]|nr:Ig-like domain-containing protein [Oscillospiraceae bacterium]
MKKLVSICSILVALLLFVTVGFAETQIVAFEDANYSVLVGQTVKPKIISQGISGKLSYVWQSGNENVATVNAGVVKGVSGGYVVISCKATAEDGTEYFAKCTVQVIVPITSIKAEKQKIEIAMAPFASKTYYEMGREIKGHFMYKPAITITPSDATNQTLEWSSANSGIASVAADGTIFGEGSGTTTITGKATDGSGKTVKIEVTVPSCYVTEKNVTITEPEGVTLGYVHARTNGITTYNIKTSGNIATFEPLDEADGLEWLQIIPLKAGEGSLSFIKNGKTVRTVKIKVEHSAVYDNVSYPTVKISKLLGSPEESIGTKTHVKCEIVKIVPKNEPDKLYRGFVYGTLKEDDERRYVIFEFEYARLLKVGDTHTIYGTLSDFDEYVSETGLTYMCPYFTDSHIDGYRLLD